MKLMCSQKSKCKGNDNNSVKNTSVAGEKLKPKCVLSKCEALNTANSNSERKHTKHSRAQQKFRKNDTQIAVVLPMKETCLS